MEEINNDMYRKMKFYYTLHYKGSMSRKGVRVMVFNATCKQHFIYIVAVSFIGGGNQSIRRKPLTCHKSLTNLIT